MLSCRELLRHSEGGASTRRSVRCFAVNAIGTDWRSAKPAILYTERPGCRGSRIVWRRFTWTTTSHSVSMDMSIDIVRRYVCVDMDAVGTRIRLMNAINAIAMIL